MRRIFLGLILVANLSAADWYADSGSKAMSAVVWYPTPTTSCAAGTGTPLVWGAQASGDNFFANGCTAISVGADPGPNGTVTLRTDAGPGGGAAGGGFTYATASNLTMHANVTAGTTVALTISGSTNGGTLIGNIQGGAAASAYGVTDSHTAVTVTVQGNITGGSAASVYGYNYSAASGTLAVTGNITAGTANSANGLNLGNAATATITGNCVGSDGFTALGCNINSGTTATITITGNLIYGKKGSAASGGGIYFTPGAGNYVLFPKNSSYVLGTVDANATEMPTDPGIANVRTGTTYGTLTGTLAGGTGSHAFVQ